AGTGQGAHRIRAGGVRAGRPSAAHRGGAGGAQGDEVKPPPFEYVRPASLEEALRLLESPGAKVLAGGQSLVPLLNLRLARPSLLVDVGRLPGLDGIRA